MSKSILYVVDERVIGGVSIVLESYLSKIDYKETHVDVLVLHNNGDRLQDIPENINVIYGDPYFDTVDISFKELVKSGHIFKAMKKVYVSYLMKTGNIDKHIVKMRRKLNMQNYDVEIAFKDGFCTLFTGFGDSKKKISWIHTDFATNNRTLKYKKTFDICFPMFDNIVGVSENVTKAFEECYGCTDKTLTITNYVDTERIIALSSDECDEKDIDKIDKTKFNLVTLGRLCSDKGYDRLIEVANMLNKEGLMDNVTISIYGIGEDYIKLENMVRRYSLEHIIKLKGKSNNPYKYYKYYDAFILTSRSESYGLVLVEALVLGLPIITTKIASSNDIIDNGNYGITMENSVEGIYVSLKNIIKDRDKLDIIKERIKSYSYDKINENILTQILKLLEV